MNRKVRGSFGALALAMMAAWPACGESAECEACTTAHTDGIRACYDADSDCEDALGYFASACDRAFGECMQVVSDRRARCDRDVCGDAESAAYWHCDAQCADEEGKCLADADEEYQACGGLACRQATLDTMSACRRACSC